MYFVLFVCFLNHWLLLRYKITLVQTHIGEGDALTKVAHIISEWEDYVEAFYLHGLLVTSFTY